VFRVAAVGRSSTSDLEAQILPAIHREPALADVSDGIETFYNRTRRDSLQALRACP